MLLPGGEEEEGDHDYGEKKDHHMSLTHVFGYPVRAIKLVEHTSATACADYPDIKKRPLRRMAAPISKNCKPWIRLTQKASQAKQKSFVTQHAAFNYLALDYGLKQVAISGLSPDAEPSAARLVQNCEFVSRKIISPISILKKMPHKPLLTHFQKKQVKKLILTILESV